MILTLDFNMSTQLIEAIENSQFDDAFLLIEENKNDIINFKDDEGAVPLHLTTDHSWWCDNNLTSHKIAELNRLTIALIQAGANINLSYEGMLPIHYLAFQRNASIDVFKLFLVNENILNALDASNCTPLHYLIEKENWHIIDFIIQNDIQVKLPKNFEGKSPIDLVPTHAQHYKIELLKLALKSKNDCNPISQFKDKDISFLPSKTQPQKTPVCEVSLLTQKDKILQTNMRDTHPSTHFKLS